jgi:hypothetical protein
MFQLVLRGRVDELAVLKGGKNVVFVPNSESVKVAKELKAKGLTPYKVDRMIV